MAPSSHRLAREITAPIPERGDPVVVELGPGTGSFTRVIQERLKGRGRHVAVELNPRFTAWLRSRYPEVDVVEADAATLPALLAERGIAQVDVVISGLPWAAFPQKTQDAIMRGVTQVLSPHATFTTFAYIHARWTPPARRFHARLERAFEEVVVSRAIWRNIPPAVIYFARRSRSASGA